MRFSFAQDLVLPTDFRQHNLTEYNSSLLSPVFALDRNHPESIAFWSRWQWQTVDLDPSTLFLNYSRMLNEESAVGIGFFQHNTGTFLHTGGVANYAYVLRLDEVSISFGVNLFAFSRSLANEPFQSNPGIILPPEEDGGNEFLVQVAPSLQFALSNFSLGFVGENAFDYNFSANEQVSLSSQKIFLGYAGYAIPISQGSDGRRSTFLRPTVYYKSIPGTDNQYGLSTIYSAPKFWVQGGYNSFYGISGGLGARIFDNLSIGALAEFGLDETLDGRDPSFEIVTAYYLGSRDMRKKVVGFEVEEDEEIMVPEQPIEEEEEQAQPTAEEIAIEEAREQARRDQEEIERQMETERQLRQQQVQDSIAQARAAEEAAARISAEKEEAPSVQPSVDEPKEEERPDPNEKYQESTITKEGVAPGYYLIVNVFSKQNYYNSFMEKLRNRGLNPGSFVRPANNYNYVYLERYDTLSEARAAKRSRYNGRYSDEIWIFAVLPD